MAKQYQALDDKHTDFILRQHIFFTASATQDSRVNISPREIAALRVVDQSTIIYLDRTGSGNETAAHLLADGRMTIMLCSFEGPPQIMRLYERGQAINWSVPAFQETIDNHFDGQSPLGTRQLMRLDINLVQTSCGFGVPLFDHQGERASLENWSENKGEEGIRSFWENNNETSMDGLPTGILSR